MAEQDKFLHPRAGDIVFAEKFTNTASVVGNGGTISGNPIIVNGIGQFDRTDDTVIYPKGIAPSFDNKTSITMICSFRTSDIGQAGSNYFISLPEAGGLNGIDMRITNTTAKFDLVTQADASTSITTEVAANTWYRLGLTYDGTTLRCYKDGAEVGNDTVTVGGGLKHDLGEFALGTIATGGTKTICDLKDVVLSSRGYTAQEMVDDNDGTTYDYMNRAIADYPMHDIIGATDPFITTDVAKGANLTYGDGAGGAAPTKDTIRNGNTYAGAEYLVASGSPFATASATAISLCIWIDIDVEDFDGVFIPVSDTAGASSGANDGYFFLLDDRGGGNPTKGINFSVHAVTNDTNRSILQDNVINNGINCLVLTYSAATDIIGYVDGVDVGGVRQGTGAGDYAPNTTKNFTLGATETLASFFIGGILAVKCFDFALTPTQVKDLYNKGPKYLGNL